MNSAQEKEADKIVNDVAVAVETVQPAYAPIVKVVEVVVDEIVDAVNNVILEIEHKK